MGADVRTQKWTDWLTDLRLSRWNYLRDRAGLGPMSKDEGAKILANLDKQMKWSVLHDIKERLG